MKNKYTFLAIDDDPEDLKILKRYLEKLPGFEVDFIGINDVEGALSALNGFQVDLIFVDYLLSGSTGIDALKEIREAGYYHPVILLTGQESLEVAIEAIRAGVADYLFKNSLQSFDLLRAITNALEKADLKEQIKTLSGLLPVCAWCKKIADDDGTWHPLEVYIHNHSEAEFTHGICPECSTKMTGDFTKKK